MSIEVQLFIADYVIRGQIENDGERLTDVLNLKNDQGLVLLDAQAASLHTLGKVPPRSHGKGARGKERHHDGRSHPARFDP